MSDIPTCLSVYAVAAWANNAQSLPQMRKAVEAYVAKHPPQDELPALVALQDALRDIRIDSAVATEIQVELLNRVALLSAMSDLT